VIEFAHPWAAALLGLALPIVAMYLYKLHRDRRPIASALLVRILRDDRPASRRARRSLRYRLSLALTLLALAAAVIALLGPRGAAGRGQRIVIVVDRSASMGTRDSGGLRLASAATLVQHVVERADAEDEVALLAAGGDGGVVVPPTRSHADVIAAASLMATQGARGDNRDDALVFRIADGLCRDRERTSLIVISDGAGLVLPPVQCKLSVLPVGRDAENVGITALSARALDGLGLYDVHVAVASTATTERHVDVALSAGGEVLEAVALAVPPKGDAERTLRITVDKPGAPGGRRGDLPPQLVAQLPGGDALPLDDRAELALADAGPVSVLLVTARPHSLVSEALQLHPRVKLTLVDPDHVPAAAFDLIVLEDAPKRALPASPHVVALGVSAGADAPVQPADAVSVRAVVRWDYDAPWFRYVDLHDLIIAKARLVTGGQSVVDTEAGALVAKATWGNRELVVTGFAIDETDLVLRAAFPNLVANLIDWATPVTASTVKPVGVLASAESHVTPRPLAGTSASAAATGSRWPRIVQLLAVLAIALLLAEQLLGLRRRKP
jgi:VWA domain-containing protein/aerotolerance regulator-like protein